MAWGVEASTGGQSWLVASACVIGDRTAGKVTCWFLGNEASSFQCSWQVGQVSRLLHLERKRNGSDSGDGPEAKWILHPEIDPGLDLSKADLGPACHPARG